MPIWFRRDGGNWNGSLTANPATDTGGYSFAGVRGQPMFICGQGADSNISVNFGQSAFAHAVPSGFTAGWPAVAGGWSSFDPDKSFGPVTLSNGNRSFTVDSFNGFVQSVDGYTEGSFYYEFTNVFNGFFTTGAGTGIGREYPGIGPDYWESGGLYGPGNDHGGVGMFGGVLANGYHAAIINQNVRVLPDFGLVTAGTIISVAVRLEPIRFQLTELDVVQAAITTGADRNRFVTLRYSDDAGANWSEPINQTMGEVGEYDTSVQWLRLGMARSRVISLEWSSMFPTALTGAMIRYEIAKT